MAGNSNLHMSRASKTDEFYTQLSTIEDEIRHYRDYFKGKVVLCNCDDPYESNFFKYFAMNFNSLGLKKLIATCYATSPIAGSQLSLFDVVGFDKTSSEQRHPYKIVITEVRDENGDGAINLSDIEYLLRNQNNVLTLLEGDGDFRSQECIELLKECDIIVTNPPFSLMKEYIPLMVNSGKLFLILGNINHATFNETFRYFKESKIWIGYNSGHFWFMVPDYYEVKDTDFKVDESGQKWRRMGNCCWFTNMDIEKRHQPLDLYKRYNPQEYPRYDTFEAIECGHYNEIPKDTDKIIGVPISYLAYHCDEQFEIVGEFRHGCDNEFDLAVPKVNGKSKYTRIAIRNRVPEKVGD
ncbi:MAG: adenine-specific methyltransferase EcoRI family protein [Clostridiaceae bacterium]